MSTIRPSQSPTIAPTQQPQQTDVVRRPTTGGGQAAKSSDAWSNSGAQKSAGSDKLLGKVNSGSLGLDEIVSNQRSAGVPAASVMLKPMTVAEGKNIGTLSAAVATALDTNIANHYSDATYAKHTAAQKKLGDAVNAYCKRIGLKPGSKDFNSVGDRLYYSQLVSGTEAQIARVAPYVKKAKTAKDKAAVQRRLSEMGKWLQSYRNKLGQVK